MVVIQLGLGLWCLNANIVESGVKHLNLNTLVVIVWQLDLQLSMQSVLSPLKFESRSWQGVLDTAICGKVVSDL